MKSDESQFLELLSNHNVTFFIPPYQRNYEWDREQCEAFLNDVINTAQINSSGGDARHFFGSVTYFQDGATSKQGSYVRKKAYKLVLIDGQQRITTAMLFLAAVRDLTDDPEDKAFIDDNYLKNAKASDETEYKIKLKQTETDWPVYCKIIFGQEPEGEEKNSAVYQNYLFFKKALSGEGKSTLSGMELLQYGLELFRVITIELEPQNPWENPQEIFESMNSLGKSLSLADLVRNYLLLGMPASEQETLYKAYWLPMEKRLPNKISDFIRDYMQLRDCKNYPKAKATNYKSLYAFFKSLFDSEPKADLTKDLCKYSAYYAYIVVAGTKTGIKKVDNKLADIRQIGVTTSYSFLLGLLSSWKEGRLTDQDILILLDVLLVYFIRRRIIAQTGAENKNIPELAQKIKDIEQAADKKAYLYQLLSNQENSLRVPNDPEVERQLLTMNFANFKHAKFILSLLEESLTKSRPASDDENLSLEHIMPQTLNPHWEEYLADDPTVYNELVNNIGNITLIRHNSELGQKPFSEKKKTYEGYEGLQIAKKEITNRSKWNRKSITNRAKWIIQYILQNVLPIPDEMRYANNFSPQKSRRLSFADLALIYEYITFIRDKSIRVQVISDNEVLFEGKSWRLSTLTRELETRRKTVTPSGSYSGASYWEYNGNRLSDLMKSL